MKDCLCHWQSSGKRGIKVIEAGFAMSIVVDVLVPDQKRAVHRSDTALKLSYNI